MISVIIPAYNIENYLEDCVMSVAGQSYGDLEIIIVDDGSTDSTSTIADNLAAGDSRIRVIHRPNGGLSAARNSGIDIARGEWLMFVDGDDMLAPDAVETLLQLAERHDADIAAGNYTRHLPFKKSKKDRVYIFDGEEALLHILYQKRIEPSAWGKLYRRRLFDTLRYREGILYEDLDLVADLMLQTRRVVYTTQVVCYYRPNPTSILNTFSPRRADVLDITRRLEEQLAPVSDELTKAAKDRRLSANFNILGLILANKSQKSFGDTVKDCREVINRHRRQSLFNPRVRAKNKLGIALSYLGRPLLDTFLKFHYRRR